MAPTDSFIIFGGISQEGRILWISPSVYDILGFEPEELIGRPGYELISPDDHADLKEFRKEYFINDLIASQMVVRFKRKDGPPLSGAGVVSFCYDFTVAVITALDSGPDAYLQRRAHSTTMNRRMGYKKEEFERMRRHHEAFAENAWNHQALEPEARVCLIINRFTRNLIIMYASSACEKVFHVDPDEITGKPVLLYIRSDDMGPFVEQVDLIKSTAAVSQIRFWFQSPNWPQEIPCEGIIIGTTDGIVAVVRRCKPFVRKRLIGSREHFEKHSRNTSMSSSSGWTRSYSSSLASELSVSTSSPHTQGCYYGLGSFGSSPQNVVSRETPCQLRMMDLDDSYNDEGLLRSSHTGFPMMNHQDRAGGNIVTQKGLAFQEVVTRDYYEEVDAGDDDDMADTVVRGMVISRLDDGHVG